MRFPPSFLERLRSQLLVSEVIGRRVAIKKHGREFQALCPFHNEKTPSFTINDDKGFYHCFGCGAHGDAIGFTMKYERLTYPEAVEKLARDLGIPMPEMTREEVQRAEKEKTQLSACEAACRWFESQLAQHHGARAYAEKRGLSEETLRKFRIGFAPDLRDGLYQHLLKNGYAAALMIEAGLVAKNDDGHLYDRFRGRLIFPIRSGRGDIVAFGGRLLDNNNKTLAKYLNSPETPLFKKGEMLYNLDLAKSAARERERVAVLEGYMDVVAVAQSGVDYAVATLGTAVTPAHLSLLWKLCKEPVLCLDGDAAGKRAMARAAETALPLLKPGYSLRFAVLPKGEDPDSYVQKHGRASFENILAHAEPLYQSLWETLRNQHQPKIGLPEGRAEFEAELSRVAGKIEDAAVKKYYADYFKNQLWQHLRQQPRRETQKRAPQVTQLSSIEDPQAAAVETLMTRLLQLLIRHPALLHKSAVEETLSHLDLGDRKMAALREALLAFRDHSGTETKDTMLAYLRAELPQHDWSGMGDDAVSPALTAESAWQLWNDTVNAYQIACLQTELNRLQPDAGGDLSEADYQRMIELQQAIRKALAARTFAPPESDVA